MSSLLHFPRNRVKEPVGKVINDMWKWSLLATLNSLKSKSGVLTKRSKRQKVHEDCHQLSVPKHAEFEPCSVLRLIALYRIGVAPLLYYSYKFYWKHKNIERHLLQIWKQRRWEWKSHVTVFFGIYLFPVLDRIPYKKELNIRYIFSTSSFRSDPELFKRIALKELKKKQCSLIFVTVAKIADFIDTNSPEKHFAIKDTSDIFRCNEYLKINVALYFTSLYATSVFVEICSTKHEKNKVEKSEKLELFWKPIWSFYENKLMEHGISDFSDDPSLIGFAKLDWSCHSFLTKFLIASLSKSLQLFWHNTLVQVLYDDMDFELHDWAKFGREITIRHQNETQTCSIRRTLFDRCFLFF